MRNLCIILLSTLFLGAKPKTTLKICNTSYIEVSLDTITVTPKPKPVVSKRLPKRVTDYIKEFYPAAVCTYQEYGIPISITLGVGALESGWATDSMANVSHNYHGLYKGPRHKAYPNRLEGFRAFAKFLRKYERYKPLIGVTDYKEVCQLLHTTGYNPYPHYPAKLQYLIEWAGLHKLDEI